MIDAAECKLLTQVAVEAGDEKTQQIVKEYDKLLAKVDANADGKIQASEFKAYFKTNVPHEDIKLLAGQLRRMIGIQQGGVTCSSSTPAEVPAVPAAVVSVPGAPHT